MNAEDLCREGDSLKAQGQYKDAFARYQASAEGWCGLGMYRLAECYDKGLGTDMCKTLAKDWYGRAAELHIPDSGDKFLWLENHPEFVNMVDGKPYNPADSILDEKRRNCRRALRAFNAQGGGADTLRRDLQLQMDESASIHAPFHCDYGENILIGAQTRIARGCLILDSAPVYIGKNVAIGQCVHIYTATHPLEYRERNKGEGASRPVRIGDNVQIGKDVVICPGVEIGDCAVIGDGAVVRGNVPPKGRCERDMNSAIDDFLEDLRHPSSELESPRKSQEDEDELSKCLKTLLQGDSAPKKEGTGNVGKEFEPCVPSNGKDGVRTFEQIRRAAENEDAETLYQQALRYDEGRGVPLSKRTALHYFRLAAEKEHQDAKRRHDWLYAHESFICMVDGENYSTDDKFLRALRSKAASTSGKYGETEDRALLDQEMHMAEGTCITPPFTWEYGSNIFMENGTYVNKCCYFDDSAPIYIGRNVIFGPGVRVITSQDSPDGNGMKVAKPVVIEDNCWICGKVTIYPGVKVGAGAVVGAGSEVKEDVPPNTLVMGNPAKVTEKIKQD